MTWNPPTWNQAGWNFRERADDRCAVARPILPGWLCRSNAASSAVASGTILILQKFSIDLAHPWGSRGIGPPHPSGTPHRHPWAPPEQPLSTPGHSRGTFEFKNLGSSRDFFSRGEPRIMYSFALGQPGQSGQISFRGEGNVRRESRHKAPLTPSGGLACFY